MVFHLANRDKLRNATMDVNTKSFNRINTLLQKKNYYQMIMMEIGMVGMVVIGLDGNIMVNNNG